MDAKESALKGLKNAFNVFGKDLEALPAEAFDQHFGGKARTVADIVREVTMVNDHLCLGVRGEDQFDWPEGWITAPEDLRTKEASMALFETTKKFVLDTMEGMTLEQLSEMKKTEHGEASALDQCRFMSLHLWYHSGQLNFIQTLLGDDAWHW